MPSITSVNYPLDYTGTAASNFIANEQVSLGEGAVRAFCPQYAPYFKKNIVIRDQVSGLVLTENQYRCHGLVPSASALCAPGSEVYSIVVILDDEVSSELGVDYQTVGAPYTSGYDSIQGMLNNLLSNQQVANTNPLDWGVLENLPQGVPSNLHLHSLGETGGWEFLTAQLEKLRLAILLGDQLSKNFVMSYLDQAIAQAVSLRTSVGDAGTALGDHIQTPNAHGVDKTVIGLPLVQNYPVATLQEALAGVRTDRYMTAELVTAVVQNRINLGLDAHVLDLDNPHELTKAHIGLGLVVNAGVASAEELQTPISGMVKYVTNQTARQWLTDYFSTINGPNAAAIQAAAGSADDALQTAVEAKQMAQQTQAQVAAAVSQLATATARSNEAVLAANANLTSIEDSESAAQAALNEYVSQAIIAAEAAAYQRGFNDGVASV